EDWRPGGPAKALSTGWCRNPAGFLPPSRPGGSRGKKKPSRKPAKLQSRKKRSPPAASDSCAVFFASLRLCERLFWMYFLGIETSGDETAAAVFTEEPRILASVIASQTDLHARVGGVVPELAARPHLHRLLP